MGWHYAVYRTMLVVKTKVGWQRKQFVTNPPLTRFITLEGWKENMPRFFFQSKADLKLVKQPQPQLAGRVEKMRRGVFTFFGHQEFDLGVQPDWLVNPSTGHRYDIKQHFTDVPDLSSVAGDIKYVWELSRFGCIQDFIRYDYHHDQDTAPEVFDLIMDFIDKNPINQGPHYKCSQEISLRILNWTYALYYYSESANLTDLVFEKIINSIYWQLQHVYKNINFSRIAVRNNHAITETLMLYVSGLLFPFFPESSKWSRQGKAWFEQEVAYQVYDDGSYLQHSMNYHRVVIQLLTIGLRLNRIHKVSFDPVVEEKAQLSLDFLTSCMDLTTGFLPNYGNNDGALFFKWTEDDYRDYRSQLDDLRAVLSSQVGRQSESQGWYGLHNLKHLEIDNTGVYNHQSGGYYLINEPCTTKTFLRCSSYRDRPGQADNLHLDIWHKGKNYLWDPGTYKYNASVNVLADFVSSKAHNTATIDGKSHMLKGGRFIWYYWIKKSMGKVKKEKERYVLNASFTGYRKEGGLQISRTVVKCKNQLCWTITDSVQENDLGNIQQHWQINPQLVDRISITAIDLEGNHLPLHKSDAYYSGSYGKKEPSIRYTYSSSTNEITTTITIKE